MNKVPYVERCPMSGGLKGECAYLWALFIANEADMDGDYVTHDRFKTIADQLAPKKGVPIPSSVHYSDLENVIAKYAPREYVYPGSDPQE